MTFLSSIQIDSCKVGGESEWSPIIASVESDGWKVRWCEVHGPRSTMIQDGPIFIRVHDTSPQKRSMFPTSSLMIVVNFWRRYKLFPRIGTNFLYISLSADYLSLEYDFVFKQDIWEDRFLNSTPLSINKYGNMSKWVTLPPNENQTTRTETF